MLDDRYEPMNLFEVVPSLGLRPGLILTQMDILLEDDTLILNV